MAEYSPVPISTIAVPSRSGPVEASPFTLINPVIAWRLHPTLTLAIGPTFNYSDANLQSATFKFDGDGFGFGFTAGLLWQPHEKWSFGLNFHSATDLTLDGNSDFPFLPGTSTSTDADVTGTASFLDSVVLADRPRAVQHRLAPIASTHTGTARAALPFRPRVPQGERRADKNEMT